MRPRLLWSPIQSKVLAKAINVLQNSLLQGQSSLLALCSCYVYFISALSEWRRDWNQAYIIVCYSLNFYELMNMHMIYQLSSDPFFSKLPYNVDLVVHVFVCIVQLVLFSKIFPSTQRPIFNQFSNKCFFENPIAHNLFGNLLTLRHFIRVCIIWFAYAL